MALSWNDAKAIIDVVLVDVSCQAAIEDPLAWGQSLWLAGSVRNIALIFGGVYDNDRSHFDRVSCVGISKFTSEAINAAAAHGRPSGSPKLPNVRNCSTCHRVHWRVHHDATWVVMTDLTEYVFDWHATLNIRNPIISPRSTWSKAEGAVEFFEFPASGWR